MMDQLQMDRDTLTELLQADDVTRLSFDDIVFLFNEEKLAQELPEGHFQIDPRTNDRIVYHAARSIRPHDNFPKDEIESRNETDCLICKGKTTGILDATGLSEGFTFINKNLYPVLFPLEAAEHGQSGNSSPTPYGLHFLQWTSSYHDRDWHNMPVEDCSIVMSRLAALERVLIEKSPEGILVDSEAESFNGMGHALIFKNYGRSVGASISHGHQQILFSNITPARTLDHLSYAIEHHELMTSMLLRETPDELKVKEYSEAVLLVPAFMRRPYEMFLVLKDTSRCYLHELSSDQIADVAEGWHDAAWLIHKVMPELGKEIAYNVSVFNGPGAGIYCEFLPHTQPMGGLERIGLYVCQETPIRAAQVLRESLEFMS